MNVVLRLPRLANAWQAKRDAGHHAGRKGAPHGEASEDAIAQGPPGPAFARAARLAKAYNMAQGIARARGANDDEAGHHAAQEVLGLGKLGLQASHAIREARHGWEGRWRSRASLACLPFEVTRAGPEERAAGNDRAQDTRPATRHEAPQERLREASRTLPLAPGIAGRLAPSL